MQKSQYGIYFNFDVMCTKSSDAHNFKIYKNGIEKCTSQLQILVSHKENIYQPPSSVDIH